MQILRLYVTFLSLIYNVKFFYLRLVSQTKNDVSSTKLYITLSTAFVSFKFHTVHKTEQILKFKMNEAGTIKQVKHKDLSLADKFLVIDEPEKKTWQSAVAKKLEISQSQV